MKAWLVRWISASDGDGPIVTILSARLGAETVRCRVEQLHTDLTASIQEKLRYSHYSQPEPPPPARLEIGRDGRPCIHCGHNPFLMACRVENLRIESGKDGIDVLHWVYGSRQQKQVVDCSWQIVASAVISRDIGLLERTLQEIRGSA